MFDPRKLTYKSQETIAAAAQLATSRKHLALEAVHLFSVLLTAEGPSKEVLQKLGDTSRLLELTNQKIDQRPTLSDNSEPKMSSEMVSVLQKAAQLTEARKEEYISQDILLLALVDQSAEIKELLNKQQISYSDIEKEVDMMRQGQPADSPTSDETYNVLEKYTLNLTKRAKDSKLDPVIGRDQEIRRVMQVLSRRTKNNPVLIGEPGVGKTAIVEGLAQRINAGDVPESLQGKELLVLDISSVLAGAKFRGEFEERLKAIVKQLTSRENHYIVFIDELHTIVGAGSAEGAVDASNMLKPGLARGELHVIGATTLNEYRQYIEKDSALERRFQPVYVNEPSPEDSVAILRGLKEKYEVHHHLGISDEAVEAAVALSSRYIPDRFLPDKAIYLLDEAASAIKIQAESKPEELDLLQRKITQLEIEKKALKKEKSEDAKQKAGDVEGQLSNLKEDANTLEIRWQSQKEQLEKINQIRAEIDSLKATLEEAERSVQLDEAAKIKYGDLPEKQKQLEELEKKWREIPNEQKLIKDVVSEEDIATVVARWTGIPVNRLLRTEADKLTHLEDQLAKRVIGQKDAIEAVSNAIRRSRVGLAEESKPTATFLFLGPTGVGKTETAKALAEVLFDDEDALVRIDMSEYGERHSVSRLIGSPPGYVGYEQGGQLTEAVRRRPYSIILFDEIEKAHEEIFNVFLQIFDDGRLTDGQGRTVNFRNTIIIMTSNLGSKQIQEHSGDSQELQNSIWPVLKERFKPELLNRIDRIIIYEKLSPAEIIQIVDLELTKVDHRLQQQEIKLDVSSQAKQYLADNGYDPEYGARPLRRFIETALLDPIASLLTKGELTTGSTVKVGTNKTGLEISKS